jgi:hypothetical protein
VAGYAYPTTAHNSRAVTPREYEDLVHSTGPDGLIGSTTDQQLVFADSTLRGVKVRANRAAIIRGLRWESGITEESITLAANTTSGTSRIDLIVLRMTRNPWEVAPAVVQGTALANPTAPSPTYGTNTSTGVWELPLAEVTVPHNATVTNPGQVVPRAWYIGSDGQYRATSTTRPPHETGRRLWETDTGRLLVSTGSQWLTASDDATSAVSMASANWTAPTYNTLRKRNGWVMLAVTPQRVSGNFGAGVTTTMGTIPAGFRPVAEIESTGFAPSSGADVVVKVAVNGTVTMTFYNAGISTGRFVNLPVITYPVAY